MKGRQPFSSTDNANSILTEIELNEAFDLTKVDARAFRVKAGEIRRNLEQQKDKEKVLIHYDNGIWPEGEQGLRLTLRTDSAFPKEVSKERFKKKNRWRNKTKHRIVTSFVTGYMVTDIKPTDDNKPYRFLVTSACAPNAMGTSEDDLKEYFGDNNLSHYKSTMKLIYKRCIAAQIAQGTQVLIIPPLGLGVYLKELNKREKKQTIKVSYKALYEALKEITVENRNQLKEVLCVMPDFNGENQYWEPANQCLETNKRSLAITVTNARADFLGTAKKLTEKGYQVGLINAGSDRTIGGAFETILIGEAARNMKENKLPPAEETLCFATDLAYVQAINMKRGEFKFVPFPDELKAKPRRLIAAEEEDDELLLPKKPNKKAANSMVKASLNTQNKFFPNRTQAPRTRTDLNNGPQNQTPAPRIEINLLNIAPRELQVAAGTEFEYSSTETFTTVYRTQNRKHNYRIYPDYISSKMNSDDDNDNISVFYSMLKVYQASPSVTHLPPIITCANHLVDAWTVAINRAYNGNVAGIILNNQRVSLLNQADEIDVDYDDDDFNPELSGFSC